MKKILLSLLIAGLAVGCGGKKEAKEELTGEKIASMTYEEILTKAKEEGNVNSVGMPDTWANWKGTWEDLKNIHGISHTDTDMGSAEEISKFEMEKENASADIGDIGIGFTPMAMERGVTLPYKTSYWEEIPVWAKDKEGHWILGYTGTIAFIIDKSQLKGQSIPRSWEELKETDLIVNLGEVGLAAQASSGLLAAAMAYGGDETNIESGFEYFATLAEEGRIGFLDPNIQNLEKGEIQVGIVWDFNGLNYRDQIDKERFEVVIPSDGSLISGYATIINRYAKSPFSAMVAREHILSDKGQLNLAIGYAKPIRNIELPEEVKAKLLPNEQYRNAKPVMDHDAWNVTSKTLAQEWQEKVLVNVK